MEQSILTKLLMNARKRYPCVVQNPRKDVRLPIDFFLTSRDKKRPASDHEAAVFVATLNFNGTFTERNRGKNEVPCFNPSRKMDE